MSRLALHLNDAELTLSDGQRILYCEPGFAWLGDDRLTTGAEAFAHARIDPRRIQHQFWSDLTTDALPDGRFSHLSAADLASAQLEAIWRQHGKGVDELVVAVPPTMAAGNLGLLLGVAAEINLPLVAMADAAVAATRREYRQAVPVHVDLCLHHAVLTRLHQPGLSQADRTEVLSGAGLQNLYDLWLRTIAEAFVRQSRFDPLHTAATEQSLLDQLDGWLRTAAEKDSVDMQLDVGGAHYEATVESLVLTGAAAPIYEQIAAKLRAFFRAEDVAAIQVTDRVARMPGLANHLKARVGGEVFVLESGATARGAHARLAPGEGAGVRLARQLAFDQSPVDVESVGAESSESGTPTHLLYAHRAYSIGNSPLVIGSQQNGEDRFVDLADDMPGVSRRHCSLSRRNGQCVIEDHSRYGTFLNGHRIDGSSVLHIGDSLRIGSPGIEFELITTETEHG